MVPKKLTSIHVSMAIAVVTWACRPNASSENTKLFVEHVYFLKKNYGDQYLFRKYCWDNKWLGFAISVTVHATLVRLYLKSNFGHRYII